MDAMTSAEREWLRKLTTGKGAGKQEQTAPLATTMRTEVKKSGTRHGRGLGDVAGMDDVKKLVTEGFINVLDNRDCAEAFGIKPPSILLYGPPGCGKSFFVEKLSEQLNICYMKIVPDDLASTLVHGTQEKIGQVFRNAERKAPTLLFFDEFDAMVPHRSNDDRNYQNGEVNEFLCMLNNAPERDVYVVAATNRPQCIDRSVLRTGRFSELVFVDMPDARARESLFRLELSRLPADENIDFMRLADMTKGYNCSDISYIVKVASRKMFNDSIREKDKPYKLITQELLEATVSSRSPSVSTRELREYGRLRGEFSPKGNGSTATIGFHV